MIQTIAVVGAGAVGSFFLGGLQGKAKVWAVADGDRKDRLAREGLFLNGARMELDIRTPQESRGADLIVVCVKYGALPGILDDLALMADDHTILLCPMNGVDSEDIIAARLGREHLLHSFMIIAAERSGNHVFYNTGVTPCLHYGRVEGYACPEDLEAVKELAGRAGLEARLEEEIITSMWNKFALNISTNIAQAIVGCNYGAYKTSPYMNALGQGLCDELLAVARAKHITCTFDNQEALRTIGTNDTARFSTLQDLSAGRHTEVDMFCGTIVRMGKEAGVATPFNEFAWLAIKALEEKNDGKIS